MNSRGFSLIELVVIVALIGTLSAIGTFGFSQYSRKSQITNQTRQLYGDLMEYRIKAMYEKKNWTFKISAGSYGIYSSSNTTVSPVTTVTLKQNVESDSTTDIVYDTHGLANVSGKSVCVSATNDATVDSVVISETRVQVGKKTGVSCVAANIEAQ